MPNAIQRNQRILLGAAILLSATAFTFWQVKSVRAERNLTISSCAQNDEDCYVRALANATYYNDVDQAFTQIKDAFENDSFVQTQCHQLGHIIGRTAYEKFKELEKVFPMGDSFCWSGYYHGAIEQAVGDLGKDSLTNDADQLCKSFETDKYSFNHFNCVHGLGHGFMAVEGYELPTALDDCGLLTGSWEQESCYGGVFMENVMLEARENGNSNYLRENDLLFPCNWIEQRYKQQCYLMQTSYILAHNGYDFADGFERCSKADVAFVDTCYQSMGRDASGTTESNVTETITHCKNAPNDNAYYNCMVGAVKDFVSYYSSTEQASDLCAAFGSEIKQSCLNIMEAYYETF